MKLIRKEELKISNKNIPTCKFESSMHKFGINYSIYYWVSSEDRNLVRILLVNEGEEMEFLLATQQEAIQGFGNSGDVLPDSKK